MAQFTPPEAELARVGHELGAVDGSWRRRSPASDLAYRLTFLRERARRTLDQRCTAS
jgi:hypothetical protein